jgi:anti-anti-sigma factor
MDANVTASKFVYHYNESWHAKCMYQRARIFAEPNLTLNRNHIQMNLECRCRMQTDVTIHNANCHHKFIHEPQNAVEGNMRLKINTVIHDQTAILVCEGPIVRGEEINVLYGKVILQHSSIVILDLSGVTRMDAAGLGILVACYQALLINQRRLVLQNPSAHVSDLLHRTNLHLLFEIVGSDHEQDQFAMYQGAAI